MSYECFLKFVVAVFDEGFPLCIVQLFLHFSVGAAPSAGMEMDIIVEKTSTVKEVRKHSL